LRAERGSKGTEVAGRFRPALPSVDGAASTVAPDPGQPVGAMRGGVLVSQARREAAENADFCRRRGRSAPDVWKVAEDEPSVRRQHRSAVVRGCASWLGLVAVMDDHGVRPGGHKTEVAHGLAASGTGGGMVDRQRFGGYQQHVLEEPPDELVGRDGLRRARARRGSPTPPKPPTEGLPRIHRARPRWLGQRPAAALRVDDFPASCRCSPSSFQLFSGDIVSPDKFTTLSVTSIAVPPSQSR
jgi:hypothetical protein